uniref:Uncharacterized protein C11orf65 homolog n=1 Tax=Phallusia mammillata TaxID=59560 RepID=A0A6F9D8G9_9ASCI|nr:uncharacterized protein C11orf65 homolog [Phallusia mammillata]
MLEKKEAVSILSKAGYASSDGDDGAASMSLKWARASKSERLQVIASKGDSLEKSTCAAIEISRRWRGFCFRKTIRKAFIQDKHIQEKLSEHELSPDKVEDLPPVPSTVYEYHEVSEHSLQPSVQEIEIVQETSERSVVPEVAVKHSVRRPSPPPPPQPKQIRPISSKFEAATIIQRAWRKHIDMQVFRYYRDLINFRGQGDPSLMLRCINPTEAKLLDAASGSHVRFRLAGEKFPPNIYYKIYTHRPIVDMCANSPKDYTAPAAKSLMSKQVHNKNLSMNNNQSKKEGWYARNENNGWRLVSDRLIYASMDPVTWDTSHKTVEFHHVKLQRKADVEHKRRQRKIQWMKKMYKEGMLKAKESDQETSELVEKAARGLVNTVNMQGSEAVMDWEVDELLQWTTALNFDDYIETWKETATSNVSEREVANIMQSSSQRAPHQTGSAVPVQFDPFALTRASSVGIRQSPAKSGPEVSAGGNARVDFRPIESHETDASEDITGQNGKAYESPKNNGMASVAERRSGVMVS